MQKTKVYYQPWGKKFKCRFCFMEKQLTKILTVEQVKEIQADDSYQLIRT